MILDHCFWSAAASDHSSKCGVLDTTMTTGDQYSAAPAIVWTAIYVVVRQATRATFPQLKLKGGAPSSYMAAALLLVSMQCLDNIALLQSVLGYWASDFTDLLWPPTNSLGMTAHHLVFGLAVVIAIQQGHEVAGARVFRKLEMGAVMLHLANLFPGLFLPLRAPCFVLTRAAAFHDLYHYLTTKTIVDVPKLWWVLFAVAATLQAAAAAIYLRSHVRRFGLGISTTHT